MARPGWHYPDGHPPACTCVACEGARRAGPAARGPGGIWALVRALLRRIGLL